MSKRAEQPMRKLVFALIAIAALAGGVIEMLTDQPHSGLHVVGDHP